MSGMGKKKKKQNNPENTVQKSQNQTPKQKNARNLFQEYSEAFVVAVILAILIRAFLVQAFKIPSRSMVPTLLEGDHILVSKFIYGVRIPFTDKRWPRFSSPQRGDVIVFVYPKEREKDFIKRVIGVENDTVQIKDKQVYVNGKKVPDKQAIHSDPSIYKDPDNPRDNFGPIKVPKDRLFVMGDNRDQSHDSRFWGFVPVKDVKGEAFMIYYSRDPSKRLSGIRYDRLFSIIR
jgi:signal peptidase I